MHTPTRRMKFHLYITQPGKAGMLWSNHWYDACHPCTRQVIGPKQHQVFEKNNRIETSGRKFVSLPKHFMNLKWKYLNEFRQVKVLLSNNGQPNLWLTLLEPERGLGGSRHWFLLLQIPWQKSAEGHPRQTLRSGFHLTVHIVFFKVKNCY